MAENFPSFNGFTTPKNDVNSEYLATLIEMGIPNDLARQALILVENRSLEEALSIVFNEPSPSALRTTFENSREQAIQANFSGVSFQAVESDSDSEIDKMYKMLFVVNGSLKMSSGKMCAQVAHAAVDLYSQLNDQRSKALNYWTRYGQTKIVVRGNSAEELFEIQSQASRTKGIVTAIIQDAGRTEIETSSVTCLGLFGTNSNLDPITGHLKLMHDCLKCSNNDSITKMNSDGRQRQTTKRARGKQKNDIKGEESPAEDSTVVAINSQSDILDVQSTITNTDGHVKQTETEIVEIK